MLESDIHMAKKKLKVQRRSTRFSFVSTVWKGDIFMGTFDNIMGKLIAVYSPMYIVEDDINELEKILFSIISK